MLFLVIGATVGAILGYRRKHTGLGAVQGALLGAAVTFIVGVTIIFILIMFGSQVTEVLTS